MYIDFIIILLLIYAYITINRIEPTFNFNLLLKYLCISNKLNFDLIVLILILITIPCFYISTVSYILFAYLIYLHIDTKNIIISKSNNIIKYKLNEFELYELKNILSDEECDQLINLAKNLNLKKSSVLNKAGIELDNNFRDSNQIWIPNNNNNNILIKISELNKILSNLPIENQELLQIAQYNHGGLFKLHLDCCIYDKKTCDKIANYNNSGQRKTTLLIYLNDNFDNGETEFPLMNVKIKPKKGSAIFFNNVNDNEKILVQSFHQGNKVMNGEKWIATKWTHVNKFI